MTRKDDWYKVVDRFLAHWGRRVDRGEVSRISGLEEINLRIFVEWLAQRGYEVRKAERKYYSHDDEMPIVESATE